MTFLCWPDTEHPAYAKDAAVIRDLMSEGRRAVVVANPSPPAWATYGAPPPYATKTDETRLLTIRRAWSLAPYVGKPFVYIWDVAIDDLNRWVAGPAHIEYLPENLTA